MQRVRKTGLASRRQAPPAPAQPPPAPSPQATAPKAPHPQKGPEPASPARTPGLSPCSPARPGHSKIIYLAVDNVRRSTRGFGSEPAVGAAGLGAFRTASADSAAIIASSRARAPIGGLRNPPHPPGARWVRAIRPIRARPTTRFEGEDRPAGPPPPPGRSVTLSTGLSMPKGAPQSLAVVQR